MFEPEQKPPESLSETHASADEGKKIPNLFPWRVAVQFASFLLLGLWAFWHRGNSGIEERLARTLHLLVFFYFLWAYLRFMREMDLHSDSAKMDRMFSLLLCILWPQTLIFILALLFQELQKGLFAISCLPNGLSLSLCLLALPFFTAAAGLLAMIITLCVGLSNGRSK